MICTFPFRKVPPVECFILFISYHIHQALKTLLFLLLSLFYFRHNHILTAIARIGKDGVSAADIRDTFLAYPQKKDKEQLHRQGCWPPNWVFISYCTKDRDVSQSIKKKSWRH